MPQQRLDLGTQPGVVPASPVQKRRPLGRVRNLGGTVEDLLFVDWLRTHESTPNSGLYHLVRRAAARGYQFFLGKLHVA
jgi:hypothetical protein